MSAKRQCRSRNPVAHRRVCASRTVAPVGGGGRGSLARVGVEDVQTTRYAKDGGIDGTGRLRINEFVTQPIAFQAKKFDVSGRKVASEEIQRFRGAIGGHIAKGIFFTTTAFSEDAKREAKALGKVEIELVDLDRILEICENYQIGLIEQKILVAEPSFFARFRRQVAWAGPLGRFAQPTRWAAILSVIAGRACEIQEFRASGFGLKIGGF
jgi:Restriction endonuclease